jgi:hypothetical protein
LRQELATAFGIRAGGNFSSLFADQGLSRVQQLPFVEAAEYRLYQGDFINTASVALLVRLQPEPPEESARNPGTHRYGGERQFERLSDDLPGRSQPG